MKIIKSRKISDHQICGQFDCGNFPHFTCWKSFSMQFYLLNIILIFYWRNFSFQTFSMSIICEYGGVSCSVHNYNLTSSMCLFLMYNVWIQCWLGSHLKKHRNINLSWNLSLFPIAKVQKSVFNLCECVSKTGRS